MEDQDGHKIMINKAGNTVCHEDCLPYLCEFLATKEIYKTFFNNDMLEYNNHVSVEWVNDKHSVAQLDNDSLYNDDDEAIDK